MEALLWQLSDAELRYIGILTERVIDRLSPGPARVAAWHQLTGLFRSRFDGIAYPAIRQALLESSVSRAIYMDADDLLSGILRREQGDADLTRAINDAETAQFLMGMRRQSLGPAAGAAGAAGAAAAGSVVGAAAGSVVGATTTGRGGVGSVTIATDPAELADPGPTPVGLDRFRVASPAPSEFLRDQPLDPQEVEYFCKLDEAERSRIEAEHAELSTTSSKPTRFRVIDSRLPAAAKADILRKLDAALRPGPHGGMVSLLDPKYQQWVDQALQLPLGVFRPLPVDPADPGAVSKLLDDMRRCLDRHVMGQAGAKEALVEVVAACVSNPEYAGGSVLGLCGEPGVGKTSLVRKGLAHALDRPCIYVSLAGAGDAGHIGGFCFTFEGSRPGALAHGVTRARCMNPVFLLDEADKCSHRGIADLLCSVTDSSGQGFVDKYFADVELDLSKSIFVFCYNDSQAIDPILRDRITEIKMDAFSPGEQVKIAHEYLVPALKRELNMGDVSVGDATLEHLVRDYTPNKKGGVRPVLKALKRLLLRLNIVLKARSAAQVGDGPEARRVIDGLDTGPVKVGPELVDELLRATFEPDRCTSETMFM